MQIETVTSKAVDIANIVNHILVPACKDIDDNILTLALFAYIAVIAKPDIDADELQSLITTSSQHLILAMSPVDEESSVN